MIILDFLFYYLALYFTNRKGSLAYSTPGSRTAYALGLITTSWIMALIFFTLIYVLKNNKVDGNFLFILVPVALVLMWLFQYLYVTKGRYELIKSSELFKFNQNVGMSIAWGILLFSFALPFLILIASMK